MTFLSKKSSEFSRICILHVEYFIFCVLGAKTSSSRQKIQGAKWKKVCFNNEKWDWLSSCGWKWHIKLNNFHMRYQSRSCRMTSDHRRERVNLWNIHRSWSWTLLTSIRHDKKWQKVGGRLGWLLRMSPHLVMLLMTVSLQCALWFACMSGSQFYLYCWKIFTRVRFSLHYLWVLGRDSKTMF